MIISCRTCRGSGASPLKDTDKWSSCGVCSGMGLLCDCGAMLDRWNDKACAECKKAAQRVLTARHSQGRVAGAGAKLTNRRVGGA
jgi:RecJ-like exonuclease